MPDSFNKHKKGGVTKMKKLKIMEGRSEQIGKLLTRKAWFWMDETPIGPMIGGVCP